MRGFSLSELLIALAVLGMLFGIGVPAYQEYLAKRARQEAAALLQQNALFLESFYQQTGSYKLSPTSWPPLPYTHASAGVYALDFGSTARNTDDGYYVLRASRRLGSGISEQLSLTQTGILKFCQTKAAVTNCELLN